MTIGCSETHPLKKGHAMVFAKLLLILVFMSEAFAADSQALKQRKPGLWEIQYMGEDSGSKAEQSKMQVPTKVMEFLAHRISSNVRELEGALTRIVVHASLIGQPITIETTQELLKDLLRANDRRVTIDEIQRKVAEHFNMRVADMHSERRARAVARPRQVAMFLAKSLTSRSLPEIGKKFGGRDHTTVMHAVKKVEELMASDHSFAEDIELLRRTLAG